MTLIVMIYADYKTNRTLIFQKMLFLLIYLLNHKFSGILINRNNQEEGQPQGIALCAKIPVYLCFNTYQLLIFNLTPTQILRQYAFQEC